MYYIVSDIPGVDFGPRLYVGVNSAEHFLNSIQNDLSQYIMPIIERDVEMIYSEEARHEFEAATTCCICHKALNRDKEIVVRDHCHSTGSFRGAAHQTCNVNYKVEKERYKLPIYFHNLRGYDCHLIMQAVRRNHGRIDVIAKNFERYISFSIGRLKFLDSMQFLSCGLDDLVKNLKEQEFKHLSRVFRDKEQRKLLTRKGVYPYDYMNCAERLNEMTLPSKDDFYSQLNEEAISDIEYEHAEVVWKTFKCKKCAIIMISISRPTTPSRRCVREIPSNVH